MEEEDSTLGRTYFFCDMPPPVSLSVNQYSGSGRIPRPIAAELDTRPLLDAPQKEMLTIAKKKKK